MKSLQSLLLFIICVCHLQIVFGLQESEPNNSFQSANQTYEDSTMNGAVAGSVQDPNDYFYSVPNDDGTIILQFTFTSISTSTDFFAYMYNKNGSLIGNNYLYNVGIGTFTDSLTVYCRLQDTIYFRFSSSEIVSYNFNYSTVSSGINDFEPNGSIGQANSMLFSDTAYGRLGYNSVSPDANDYFVTNLPTFGTINLYIKYNNTSSVTSSDFYSYIYNKNGSLIGNSYKYNQPLGISYDTITIYCRELDSLYFRFGSSGCFSYQFYYDVYAPTQNDVEPNNAIIDANWFNHNDTVEGRIGYISVSTDPNDYFYTVLPDDGTIEYIVKYINTSNSTSSDFFSYIYNKNGSLIGNSYLYNQPLGISYDTIKVYCRAKDTVYFRIGSSGCFSYEFNYKVIPTGISDVEPNNSRPEANQFLISDTVKGRIGYNSISADPNDYFFSVLPDDGTIEYIVKYINTSNSTSSDFFSSIYNKNGSLIGNSYLYNQPLGISYDTIRVYCRSKDTVYFRIKTSGCFSYEFNYRVVPSGTVDAEPNNSLAEATSFLNTDTVKGRIGYSSISADADDYFFSVLPDDGTIEYIVKYNNTSNSNGSDFYTYIYNENGGLIGSSNKVNQPLGVNYDTIRVYCRSKDTVYFRIKSSGCFSYEFNYRVIPSGVPDVEPNNSLGEAKPIGLSDTLFGRIGHLSVSVDNNDYFKFYTNRYSSIRSVLKFNNTSNSTLSDIYIYLYNSSGQLIFNSYYYNVQLGSTVDTLNMNCLPADTFYLRVSSSGCFDYSLDFELVDVQPDVSFNLFEIGQRVGFKPEIINADTFTWYFGDGQTSTIKYAIHNYNFGSYDVILTATKNICNVKISDTAHIEIKGVEYYTPKSAGQGGDAIIEIFGGGLDTTATVKLIKGATVISPKDKYSNDLLDHLTCVFDLHSEDGGLYDLKIEIPGENPVVFQKGFEIDTFKYPYCSAEIVGPSVWRVNRDTRFNLVVQNHGNVMASGVTVGLVWPKDVSFNFEHKQYTPPDTGKVTVEVDGTLFTLDWSEIKFIYDSSRTVTEIDSFQGKPYNGFIRFIQIPHVPANTTVELPFIARSSSGGKPSFYTFTWRPNFFGSCHSPNYTDLYENGASEMIDLVDMVADNTKNVPLQVMTKTLKVGQKHLAVNAKLAGAKFWAWWDGYDVAPETYQDIWTDLDAANAYALKTGTEELGKFVMGKGLGKLTDSYNDKVNFINKRLANNPKMSNELAGKYLDKLNKLSASNQRLQRLEAMFKTTSDLATLSDKLVALQKSVADCPELQKQVDDLIKQLDKEINHEETKETPTETIQSRDPNAIYGPVGIGSNRYVNQWSRQYFQITFENMDTATAAAQTVTVYDTLDVSVFDLSTFEFGNVTVSEKTVRMIKHQDDFVADIDLNPKLNMLVRIFARLNTSNGVISWDFVSIDPVTGDFPTDPFAGFLPPNKNYPEGEGSVSYSVALKNNLNNGIQLNNRATIIFDENEPILTNTWQNILDIKKPVSNINASVVDTSITLSLSGIDTESGIAGYVIYVSDNGGPWLPFLNSIQDTLIIAGERGHTYGFYVESKDRVYNLEKKQPAPEVSVIVTSIDTLPNPYSGELVVFPNPTRESVYVVLGNPEIEKHIFLNDVTGRTVYDLKTKDERVWVDMSKLPSGIYLMIARIKDTFLSVKVVKD
jgi:Secretion system C-terminal sorting domain